MLYNKIYLDKNDGPIKNDIPLDEGFLQYRCELLKKVNNEKKVTSEDFYNINSKLCYVFKHTVNSIEEICYIKKGFSKASEEIRKFVYVSMEALKLVESLCNSQNVELNGSHAIINESFIHFDKERTHYDIRLDYAITNFPKLLKQTKNKEKGICSSIYNGYYQTLEDIFKLISLKYSNPSLPPCEIEKTQVKQYNPQKSLSLLRFCLTKPCRVEYPLNNK